MMYCLKLGYLGRDMGLFKEEYGNWIWTYKRFWREMDECAEVYDRRIAAGLEQEPSFFKGFRRGMCPLWKAFWLFTFIPLLSLGVIAYFAFAIWEPLCNLILLGFAVYGLIACDALRYTASRYEGAKLWRRGAQCIAFFLMLSCGVAAIGFSASAAGY